jgi:hypothetical protein
MTRATIAKASKFPSRVEFVARRALRSTAAPKTLIHKELCDDVGLDASRDDFAELLSPGDTLCGAM